MLKKFLCIISISVMLPVFAGEYENAIASNQKVILYFSTPHCGYCKKFEPIYQKLVNKYGQNCKFINYNAETPYGYMLARQYSVKYVPYVIMIDTKHQQKHVIDETCLLNYSCVDNALMGFIK